MLTICVSVSRHIIHFLLACRLPFVSVRFSQFFWVKINNMPSKSDVWKSMDKKKKRREEEEENLSPCDNQIRPLAR